MSSKRSADEFKIEAVMQIIKTGGDSVLIQ